MRVSSLEYCARVTVGRLLLDEIVRKHVLKSQIEDDRRFDIFLEAILTELVSHTPDRVTDELLALLLSGKNHMKTLCLEGCDSVTISGLSAALDNQPHIESLNISKCSKLATSALGDILAQKLAHLETLSCESCENLTDDIVKDIMAKCTHLRNLNLSCNQILTDQLFDFSENVRGKLNLCRLARVDLSGCQGISSTAVRYMLSMFGSFLQSINISWTKIDCTALVYLSGYSLSSAVYLATNSSAEMPFSVAELEASQEFELQLTKNQVSTQVQDKFGAPCAAPSRDGALWKDSPVSLQTVSTEKGMNGEELCSISTGVNRTHQTDATINQRPSVDENNTVSKMQKKVAWKAQPECENALNFVNKHRYNISGKRYCSMCNRSKSLGLRRAHSYTCVDEDDLTVNHSDTRNIFHNYDSRLSRSSSSLESVFLLSQTELSSALAFVKTKYAFVAQDSCHLQEVFIKSSGLGMRTESSNKNGYTDNIALRECALERNFNADSDSSRENESKNEVFQFVSLKDEETSRQLFKTMQTQYRDASKLSELTANSVPVKNSKIVCVGSSRSEDSQQFFKPFSEETGVSGTSIDIKCHVEENSRKSDKEESTGANDCELTRADLSNMGSLLSSQAEFFKPRRMFASQITDLDISQIKFYDVDVGVKCIKMFVTSNHLLQSLSISWKGLTDSVLEIIVTNEPNLMKISLAECECLSNSGIISLGQNCQQLVDLDLQGVPFISDRGLVAVLEHGLLHDLSLAECAVTDLTLQNIAKFCFASIKNLNFSWCENISDEGLTCLLESCSGLESLNLRQCEVSAQSVETLTAFGGNMSYLGLCSIQDLTDKLSRPLVRSLKNLTFIDLSWNCLLTDETLSTLMISCVMLRETVLAGLKRISSKPFLPIISGLSEWKAERECIRRRLQKQCDINTRDIGAQEVLDTAFYLPYRSLHYAPNLWKIDLSFSDKVNDTHLAEIVSVCRGTLAIDDYYSMPIKPRWAVAPPNCQQSLSL